VLGTNVQFSRSKAIGTLLPSQPVRIRKEIRTMTKQKRFSKLAIAAGLLLTASATCFAQTESNTSQAESTTSTVIAVNKAPRLDLPTVNSNSTTNTVSEATTTETRTAFSAAQFMTSAKDSLLKSNVTPAPQIRMDLSNTPQFSEPSRTKRIEFVPSRGPKLPQ
jgi:hypothetical protein